MEVGDGEIVTLIGSNGAGKSTTLHTISGLIKPKTGSILYKGEEIVGVPAHKLVGRGLVQVPEGRHVFAEMTVMENLDMGAYLRTDKDGIARDKEKVFEKFPRLKERISQTAGTLSGGEQQMLAMGRALMSRPQLLILDEPPWGWRLFWYGKFSPSSRKSTAKAQQCCWWNRTPIWPFPLRTGPMCWKPGGWSCPERCRTGSQ